MITMKRHVNRQTIEAVVESCPDHPHGCYLRISNKKISHSEQRNDVVIDYDKNGEIAGIEFWEGFKVIPEKK